MLPYSNPLKGIGAKTAQRIIVDLKDKIKMTDESGTIRLPTKNDLSKQAMLLCPPWLCLDLYRPPHKKWYQGF
jgi:hypothetical protein